MQSCNLSDQPAILNLSFTCGMIHSNVVKSYESFGYAEMQKLNRSEIQIDMVVDMKHLQ